jgi:hypothetical protein
MRRMKTASRIAAFLLGIALLLAATVIGLTEVIYALRGAPHAWEAAGICGLIGFLGSWLIGWAVAGQNPFGPTTSARPRRYLVARAGLVLGALLSTYMLSGTPIGGRSPREWMTSAILSTVAVLSLLAAMKITRSLGRRLTIALACYGGVMILWQGYALTKQSIPAAGLAQAISFLVVFSMWGGLLFAGLCMTSLRTPTIAATEPPHATQAP